jgi:hypothetical protein
VLRNDFTHYNKCDALTRRFAAVAPCYANANTVSILDDESLIFDDESLIFDDESLILDDESLIFDDENLDRISVFRIGVKCDRSYT